MPIDFEVGGVYLPPLAQALLLAVPLFWGVRWALVRLGFMRLVWHPALFEGALYAVLCATLILAMGAWS
ncbi:efflux system membrane protein [compost metagenome]